MDDDYHHQNHLLTATATATILIINTDCVYIKFVNSVQWLGYTPENQGAVFPVGAVTRVALWLAQPPIRQVPVFFRWE
jgi:hypothetical protein